jgi:hypothetical protein
LYGVSAGFVRSKCPESPKPTAEFLLFITTGRHSYPFPAFRWAPQKQQPCGWHTSQFISLNELSCRFSFTVSVATARNEARRGLRLGRAVRLMGLSGIIAISLRPCTIILLPRRRAGQNQGIPARPVLHRLKLGRLPVGSWARRESTPSSKALYPQLASPRLWIRETKPRAGVVQDGVAFCNHRLDGSFSISVQAFKWGHAHVSLSPAYHDSTNGSILCTCPLIYMSALHPKTRTGLCPDVVSSPGVV